eukprot:SAG22_NODE_958_length_6301_cov_4.995324_16_plen_57_part_01
MTLVPGEIASILSVPGSTPTKTAVMIVLEVFKALVMPFVWLARDHTSCPFERCGVIE